MIFDAHTVDIEISAGGDITPKYFELYTLLYSTTLSYIHNCVKLKSTLKSTKIKSDWGRGSSHSTPTRWRNANVLKHLSKLVIPFTSFGKFNFLFLRVDKFFQCLCKNIFVNFIPPVFRFTKSWITPFVRSDLFVINLISYL